MNDKRAERDGLERANRIIPELTARLRAHGLGQIEVRDGDLRIQLTAAPSGAMPTASVPDGRATPDPATTASDEAASRAGTLTDPIASPGVGYFLYADGLGPGMEVHVGDVIGHVEVLGVRHDVRAPADGTIRNLVAETGEAVEYGQTLVELEPAR